jgi:hypothetical protein
MNTGYAEKLFLEEIIKKELKITLPEWASGTLPPKQR